MSSQKNKWDSIKKDWKKESADKKKIKEIMSNDMINVEHKKRMIREIESNIKNINNLSTKKHICAVPLVLINHVPKLVKADIELLDTGTWRIIVKKRGKAKCQKRK